MYLSGHVPVDEAGQLVGGGFEEQLEAVFASLGRTLRAAGVGFEALARITVFVKGYQPEMLTVLQRVRARYVSATAPPASALVAVAALYDPGVCVEIDAVAVVPDEA
jgi:enamine deaminase RidA (YjgF/YER057c/UK114 family)